MGLVVIQVIIKTNLCVAKLDIRVTIEQVGEVCLRNDSHLKLYLQNGEKQEVSSSFIKISKTDLVEKENAIVMAIVHVLLISEIGRKVVID